jgi:hypothetical protein
MAKASKNTEVAGKEPEETTAAKEAAAASQDAKRRPIQTIRIGDVSASVWSREHVIQGQPRIFYSATFERSFKTRDGGYGYSKSFDPDSLGALVAVIQRTDEYLQGLLSRQDAGQ